MDFKRDKYAIACLVWILKSGVYAATIVALCNDNCIQQDGELACDLATKSCLHGCKDGFAGPECSIECCLNCKTCQAIASTSGICVECFGGFYLDLGVCMPCSKWCANDTCRDSDGYCHNGCQDGYYGKACTNKCSENCKKGLCNVINGSCTNGCSLQVLHGSHCSMACDEGCKIRECDQSGVCIHGCNNDAWDSDCSMRCGEFCKDPLQTANVNANVMQQMVIAYTDVSIKPVRR